MSRTFPGSASSPTSMGGVHRSGSRRALSGVPRADFGRHTDAGHFDPTDKTQPAVSRNGALIAFTVFSYQMRFWLMESP